MKWNCEKSTQLCEFGGFKNEWCKEYYKQFLLSILPALLQLLKINYPIFKSKELVKSVYDLADFVYHCLDFKTALSSTLLCSILNFLYANEINFNHMVMVGLKACIFLNTLTINQSIRNAKSL